MSALEDLSFACKKIICIKGEVEIKETQLQEQIFDGVEVTYATHCVDTGKESEMAEDNQTELNDCEGIREQPYECNLRPDDSNSSVRKHDISHTIKAYKSRSELNKRIKIHSGERIFQCKICSKSFTSKYVLSSHHKTHSDKKKYECTLCSEKFAHDSERLRHEKTHTNNYRKYYECENCKKYFRTEDQYRSHMKGNKCKGYASEKPFECPKCQNESFVSIELLNQHNIEVHPPPKKKHACLVCAKAYRYEAELRLHMNVHTGKLPYACTICSKAFNIPSNLRRHKLTHNFLSAERKFRHRFKCMLCEKSYYSKIGLNSHTYFHRGERPFKCEICPKSYRNPHTLKAHIKVHFDERKYECTLCSKKFAKDSGRLRHEKTHTYDNKNYHECENCKKYFRSADQYRSHLEGNKCKSYASEKPLECPKCENQSFVSIELLNQHKIEVHPPPKKKYPCSVCAKAYRYGAELRVHMNVHTGKRPYACTICSKAFSIPGSLRRHMSTHLSAEAKNRSKFKCTLCEKLCSSRSQLNCHMNMHGGERPFKCETCLKTFRSPGTLWSHKKLHADNRVSECTLCNQKFTDNNKRDKHEKTHTNSQLTYQCAKCKMYFRLEDQYRSHLEGNKCKGHALEKPFECSKCENESFISLELLNLHKVEFHPPPKKNHICLICTKTYKNKYLLNIHMNSHSGSQPYTCPICPKRFACPSSLRRHKLDHNFLSADGKIRGRFKCTLCEKSYYSKTNLNSHMYFHRGEYPFKCEICPKSFTSSHSLKTHIQSHSDERKYEKYECTLCNKKFTRNSDRRVHEKTHTNNRKKYQCEKCKMYFRLENQYDSHLKDNKCKGYALDIKEEVEISEMQLLEQILDGVEVTHVNHCVKTGKESEVVNGLCHETEGNQTEINDCEAISEQLYECNLRPDDSNSSVRKHDISHMIKTYKSRSGLNKHIKIHHGERNFQCEICSKSFTSKYLLSSHHKTHSDKKKYECTLCSEKFAQDSERLRHEKTHTNNYRKYYECGNCNKYFRSEDQYRSHMKGNKCKCNASEKLFKCSKCENESFVSIELLNQHKIEVHPLPKTNHACSVCGKAYRFKGRLRQHMNLHTGNRPYKCTICSKTFNWPGSLRRHMSTHLSAEAKHRLVAQKLNRRRFKCALCEKSYLSKKSLNSHMYYLHRGVRPFKCEICPKSFMNSDSLRNHIKRHSDVRKYEKYECTLCNKKFTYKSDRRVHEKTHTNNRKKYQCEKCKMYFRLENQYGSHLKDNKCKGYALDKPFQCPKCENESFVSIELLNQHKIEAHPPPKKNHACSVCGKAYRFKGRLHEHMNVHTGNRPYKCTICSKTFNWPGSLRRHMTTHLSAEAKNRSKFKCTLCEKLCSSRRQLNSHINMHRHKAEDECNGNWQESDHIRENKKCETQVQSENKNIQNDEQSQKNDAFEKKYKCDECKKEFICKRNLNFHLRSHLQIASM